jgi:hypothetical protein
MLDSVYRIIQIISAKLLARKDFRSVDTYKEPIICQSTEIRLPPLLSKKGVLRKTRNPYIEDNLEYILLEPNGYIKFDYFNDRNSHKQHEIFCKFIAGTAEGEAIYLVGYTVTEMKQLTYKLKKMQNITGDYGNVDNGFLLLQKMLKQK